MDKETFEKIYKAHYKQLCTFAFTIIKDKDYAEEIVQQVFFKIWEKKESNHIEKIFPYLIQSTKHEALSCLRKAKVNLELKLSSNDHEVTTMATDNEINSERFIHIKNSIEGLPEKCKQIMLLKTEEGLTHQEIAEYLNISVKTIENQVRIALKKIRESLSKGNAVILFGAIINLIF